MTSDSFSFIEEAIRDLPILSTHEHNKPFFPFEMGLDYIFSHSYVGWTGQVPSEKSPGARALFLDAVRPNSYFRWLLAGLQQAYGFEGEITPENWDSLSEQIKEAHSSGSDEGLSPWFGTLMTEIAGVKKGILDAYWEPGSDNGRPDLYRPTFRINMFLYGYSPIAEDHNGNNPHRFWNRWGWEASSFDDYISMVTSSIEKMKSIGAVALKSALAYDRSLSFSEPDLHLARLAYEKGMGDGASVLSKDEIEAFQNFVFDHICSIAGKNGLPLQCHTGLGLLTGSNPMNLLPSIERNSDTKFVLFHGGYPWFAEIGGLLHNYQNVYADMVWLPLISTSAAVAALHQWLEVACSSNRISYGSDVWTGEEMCGASLAIRQVLAQVLSEKIDSLSFNRAYAEDLAEKILYRNAEELYGLSIAN